MNSQRLRANGNNYDMLISGRGDPILLLHGFSGDKSTWDQLRRALQPTHSVIALDVLGHGASDKPANVAAYRMDRIASDIVNLLDQLDLDDAHLLGYSMGGRLALFMALRYPERFKSLILESASPGLASKSERYARRQSDGALADRIGAEGIMWFVDYWERLPLWATQRRLSVDILELQRQQRLRNIALGLANSLRGMGVGAQPNLWPQLPSLELPTLLIAGECDRKFRQINREMLQLLPRAQKAIIAGAGHNTNLESTDDFAHVVRSFLDRL